MIARRDGHTLALFDLWNNPDETDDVQAENSEVIAQLQDILTQWRESGTGAGGSRSESDSWDNLDNTVRQRLRDLGYSD